MSKAALSALRTLSSSNQHVGLALIPFATQKSPMALGRSNTTAKVFLLFKLVLEARTLFLNGLDAKAVIFLLLLRA